MLRITGKPIPQDHSVQWNETDLAYMLRRMQQDGLFYWFDHQQGKHTLIVADHVSGYDTSGTLILEASNQIVLRGGGGASLTVGPGPVLYTPSLVQGSAPPCPECLRAMAANSIPFVQP